VDARVMDLRSRITWRYRIVEAVAPMNRGVALLEEGGSE
jgi:hypothetical protein